MSDMAVKQEMTQNAESNESHVEVNLKEVQHFYTHYCTKMSNYFSSCGFETNLQSCNTHAHHKQKHNLS